MKEVKVTITVYLECKSCGKHRDQEVSQFVQNTVWYWLRDEDPCMCGKTDWRIKVFTKKELV